MREFKGKAVARSYVEGFGVYVDSISFYGDVDPETGRLADGRTIKGKILVARRSKGSTVGPYIMYSLKKQGRHPLAIVMGIADPIIIAGSVISEIPLVYGLPGEFFDEVKSLAEPYLRVKGDIVELLQYSPGQA